MFSSSCSIGTTWSPPPCYTVAGVLTLLCSVLTFNIASSMKLALIYLGIGDWSISHCLLNLVFLLFTFCFSTIWCSWSHGLVRCSRPHWKQDFSELLIYLEFRHQKIRIRQFVNTNKSSNLVEKCDQRYYLEIHEIPAQVVKHVFWFAEAAKDLNLSVDNINIYSNLCTCYTRERTIIGIKQLLNLGPYNLQVLLTLMQTQTFCANVLQTCYIIQRKETSRH